MAEPDAIADEPLTTGPDELEEAPTPNSAGELASILDRYMADLQAGEAPDRRLLVQTHPELATQLEACLAGIEFIHRATGPAAEMPATLGEFRIIRELGRGGMGVVYEAEQTSLAPSCRLEGAAVRRRGRRRGDEALSSRGRDGRPACTIPTSCRSSPSAASAACTTTPCSLSTGRSLADVLAESQRTGKPLPVRRRRPLGPSGGRGAGACPPARGDPPRHQAIEPAARR